MLRLPSRWNWRDRQRGSLGYSCSDWSEMSDNLSVVILAAGLGTRMKSKKAKVLHRAGGLSLIEHVVKMAFQITAPERVTVVVGHQAAQVQATLAHTGVQFVEQAEQKGTGDAVKMCRGAIG